MPNPGGLQLGCNVCRRRRIKCDRSQPQCQRCIKYGSPCPGYPREQDVRFRHETEKYLRKTACVVPHPQRNTSNGASSRKLKRMVSGANIRTTTDSLAFDRGQCCQSRKSSSFVGWTTTPTFLTGSLNVTWDAVLTQYLFDQLVMSVGWYSYLPQLYYRSQSHSCINATITAASSFLAANQFQDPSMLHRAIHHYGLALKAINSAIAHPERSLEDQTLFSILLLNVMDDLTGHKSCMSVSHLNGCAALLKLREARGVYSEYTPHLAHSIVIQTQQQLIEGHKLGACIPKDESFLAWLWTQSLVTPASELSALSLRVGKIKDIADQIFASSSHCESEYENSLLALIDSIDELDTDLTNWRTDDDKRWTQKTCIPGLRPHRSYQTPYYSDMQVSKVWNHWRVARVNLNSTKLDVVERLQSLDMQYNLDQHTRRDIMDDSLRTINEMVSDIMASIPFHMQQVDREGRASSGHSQQVLGGCALIWPLFMVIKCEEASSGHKTEAVQALQMIGDVLGVKQASVYLQRVS